MWLVAVRDAAIVLLAIESIVIGVLLALMLIQIRKLVVLLRDEITPLLNSAQSTMRRVETTTTFVSESVVSPLIKLRSYTEGSLEAMRNLLHIRRQLKGRAVGQATDGGSATTRGDGDER
ncbi:MAG: hypothetical protein H5T69_12770 [Chloroflexi bacterium]|nr:hypothetical protein [Chloroflexota bacterium]